MNHNLVKIGNRQVGVGQPAYIVAEIGINHNGSLDTARKLIDVAVDCPFILFVHVGLHHDAQRDA